MPQVSPAGATIAAVTHHVADVNGTRLHHVSAGTGGTPILLVHGWPETWWAFRKLIPLLAQAHRVHAVDLRGFGDSSPAAADHDEGTAVEDLHRLVEHLGCGPVHLLCQDVSGGIGFRLAATHPGDVRSLTAVESTLAGFGLERLADVLAGGSWHLGFLGARGIPSMLLPGHERDLLAGWAYPAMNGTAGAVTEDDIAELVRTYSRPGAWRGTEGLYAALFTDGGATKALAEARPVAAPVLAVDGVNHPFTATTFRQVCTGDFTAVHVEGVGHLVAQEAPDALAAALLDFTARVDRAA